MGRRHRRVQRIHLGVFFVFSAEQCCRGRSELVQVLADWTNETFPLYAFHPSRHLPPAKVRAFLDFVQDIAATEKGELK